MRTDAEIATELFASPEWWLLRKRLERKRDEWGKFLSTVNPETPTEAFRALVSINAVLAELTAMIDEPTQYFDFGPKDDER